MTIKSFGVQIIQGPQHWAILQRVQGFGVIELRGSWSTNQNALAEQGCVFACVVKEDGSGAVVPWRRCSMSEGAEWHVSIADIPTGGLYRIETCLRLNEQQPMELATRGDMIHHVAVGDIWVIAGQSNATGYGRGAVYDPPELGVHLLRHNGKWDLATHPFNESTQSVQLLNGEPVNPGHSPYLAFAKLVKSETGIPIGLLQTALGGSPLERWNPHEIGDLYQNMMEVIHSAGGKVKGLLWYQGCSDCDAMNAPSYLDRFTQMVDQWRNELRDHELPVLTVQLNRYAGYADGEEGNRYWGMVREAQRQAAMQDEQVYVVPSLDSPLSDIIHNSPAGNLLIGGRLARVALAAQYGKLVHYQAPNVRKADLGPCTILGEQTVILEFADVLGELFAIGPSERLFSIEDEQGLESVTQWSILDNNKVELILPRPIACVSAVHGTFEANPSAFPIMDTGTHLPMLSFYNIRIK